MRGRRWAPENVPPGAANTHWRQEVAGTVKYSDKENAGGEPASSMWTVPEKQSLKVLE